MRSHTCLSLSAFLIGACGLGMALIAMGTTRWRYNTFTAEEFGLFETCRARRVDCSISINDAPDYVKATASFMVIGSALILSALVCSLVAIFENKAQKVGALLYMLAGLLLLIAPATYTGVVRDAAEAVVDFGFSIWIAWASVAISLLAGIIQLLALPKKE